MHEGLKRGQEKGALQVVRTMAHELELWFAHQAQVMDAALAVHLRQVGYDVATATLSMPEAWPQAAAQRCRAVAGALRLSCGQRRAFLRGK